MPARATLLTWLMVFTDSTLEATVTMTVTEDNDKINSPLRTQSTSAQI